MGTRINSTTRIIAVMNQKGGVGKTTTTVNLGAALAETGRQVLLIDVDPQAHLTIHTGLEPSELQHSLYDLMTEDSITALDVVMRVDENIAVIPAEVDLAGLETELHGHPDRQHLMKNRLAELASGFDYVLIDCPPSLGLLTINALSMAHEVIVPMQAHFLALQGLSKLLETVQLVRQAVNTRLRVSGVILCMHDAHTNLTREVVTDLRNFFEQGRNIQMPWSGAVVYDPPIRRNIKLAECPSFGQTIFQYSPWCPGAMDYRRLAESLIAQEEARTSRKSGKTKAAKPAAAPAPEADDETEPAAEAPVEKSSSPDRLPGAGLDMSIEDPEIRILALGASNSKLAGAPRGDSGA